jgi:hypothetical protein
MCFNLTHIPAAYMPLSIQYTLLETYCRTTQKTPLFNIFYNLVLQVQKLTVKLEAI